jgi:hypothetical protein
MLAANEIFMADDENFIPVRDVKLVELVRHPLLLRRRDCFPMRCLFSTVTSSVARLRPNGAVAWKADAEDAVVEQVADRFGVPAGSVAVDEQHAPTAFSCVHATANALVVR